MLPSERRIRRFGWGAAGLAVSALVGTARVGAGYVAAPATALAVIDDPSADAQAESASTLTSRRWPAIRSERSCWLVPNG